MHRTRLVRVSFVRLFTTVFADDGDTVVWGTSGSNPSCTPVITS